MKMTWGTRPGVCPHSMLYMIGARQTLMADPCCLSMHRSEDARLVTLLPMVQEYLKSQAVRVCCSAVPGFEGF